MSAGRIVLLVFGGLLVLISIALLIGGAAVLTFDSNFKDSQGFYSTNFLSVQSATPAVVSQPADIHAGPGWFRENRNKVTVKIEAYNNVSSKPVFIGVARQSDLNSYLSGIGYNEVSDFSISSNTIHYIHHSGANSAPPPAGQTFWVTSATGSGTQTAQWDVSNGSYSVVIMNADGSAPLDAEISFGIKIPAVLHSIGLGLLIGGVVLLIGGGFVIFFGVKGR